MPYYLHAGPAIYRVDRTLERRPSWRRVADVGASERAVVRWVCRVVVTRVEPGELLGGPHFGPSVEALAEYRDYADDHNLEIKLAESLL